MQSIAIRRLLPLLVVATLVLLPLGCGGGSEESEGGQTTIGGVAANGHGSKDVSGSGEVDVELDDDYFEPTVLEGTAGQKLEITLENAGQTEHNFSLDAQNLDVDVEAGEKKSVTVTIPSSGTVSFYCKYHRGRGMAGGLTASG